MTAMADPVGRSGELIERLCALIASNSRVDPDEWRRRTALVGRWLGLRGLWLRLRQSSRDDAPEIVRAPLQHLLQAGVDEEFLVRSILFGLHTATRDYADVAQLNMHREGWRLATLMDQFQQLDGLDESAREEWTTSGIEDVAGRFNAPLTPEEEITRIAVCDELQGEIVAFLRVIDTWKAIRWRQVQEKIQKELP